MTNITKASFVSRAQSMIPAEEGSLNQKWHLVARDAYASLLAALAIKNNVDEPNHEEVCHYINNVDLNDLWAVIKEGGFEGSKDVILATADIQNDVEANKAMVLIASILNWRIANKN